MLPFVSPSSRPTLVSHHAGSESLRVCRRKHDLVAELIEEPDRVLAVEGRTNTAHRSAGRISMSTRTGRSVGVPCQVRSAGRRNLPRTRLRLDGRPIKPRRPHAPRERPSVAPSQDERVRTAEQPVSTTSHPSGAARRFTTRKLDDLTRALVHDHADSLATKVSPNAGRRPMVDGAALAGVRPRPG